MTTTKSTSNSYPFHSLTKGQKYILPKSNSYWRYLTLSSHEVYEIIYNNCKDKKGQVSFASFASQFVPSKMPLKTIEKAWSRLLHDRSSIRSSIFPKGFAMATVYMLHVESFLSERPLDDSKNIGVSSDRRELLKRFGNWVACQCDRDCGVEWNFANDVGLCRCKDGSENEKKCQVVKKLRGNLGIMDLEIKKEKVWLELTREKWMNSRA